jgi:hypothetical protein
MDDVQNCDSCINVPSYLREFICTRGECPMNGISVLADPQTDRRSMCH